MNCKKCNNKIRKKDVNIKYMNIMCNSCGVIYNITEEEKEKIFSEIDEEISESKKNNQKKFYKPENITISENENNLTIIYLKNITKDTLLLIFTIIIMIILPVFLLGIKGILITLFPLFICISLFWIVRQNKTEIIKISERELLSGSGLTEESIKYNINIPVREIDTFTYDTHRGRHGRIHHRICALRKTGENIFIFSVNNEKEALFVLEELQNYLHNQNKNNKIQNLPDTE